MSKTLKIILCIVAVAVLLAVAVGAYYGIEIGGGFRESEQVEVEVPKGAGASTIGRILQEKGVIGNALVFRLFTYGKSYEFQYGTFVLDPSNSYAELIEVLETSTAKRETHTLTVPEGTEAREIVAMLVKLGLGTEQEIKNIINTYNFDFELLSSLPKDTEYRLEGYLFPDTYEIYAEASRENIIAIIQKMLDNFESKTAELRKAAQGKDFHDIIIMASIIEREGQKADELPLVSSVFYNRIKIGMKLQSCATVQYILEERKPVLTYADTEIDNPYNTYMYEGLTPGPIANPGLAAISAAISPAQSDYLYFVAKGDGGHLFGKTYQDHMNNIASVS